MRAVRPRSPCTGLRFTQLAAALGISPAALVAQIEALAGFGTVSTPLGGLITNPGATLQDVIDGLSANGHGTQLSDTQAHGEEGERSGTTR